MMDRRFQSAIRAVAALAGAVAIAAVFAPAFAPPAFGQSANQNQKVKAQVPVETFTLENGMKFLLVRRPEKSTVAAGWTAHVGSSNERPGITGISHLFEHMMFKGSNEIGTTNIKRDLQILEEQERIQEKIRTSYEQQRLKWRRGEIDDPFDPKNRSQEQIDLEKEFAKLVEEQRSLMVKDEFDKVYTKEGASQMNAFTNQDMTVYFITVPANKLELWFWMESDRLSQPVFREFYSERDVVHEERRLRTESTPTGKYDELFEAMFWESHPYSWPVVGWPSDLRTISKAQADDYFSTYYAPNNLTAALVGNFEIAEVKELAEKYFGRIPRGKKTPPDVGTLEMEQLAQKQMHAECDCQPQIQIAYHTVPFRHKDSYALDVLAGLMNGETGRLRKSLILDKKIATTASANPNSIKWAGQFTFAAETKGDATPEQLADAWYAEVQKIIEAPIPDDEMQKVKYGIAADSFRRLDNPFFLMVQLLVYDAEGDWTYLQDSAEKTSMVTAEDVKRVAKTFLKRENSTVGIYNRKGGSQAEEEPVEFKDLPADAKAMAMQRYKALKAKVAGMTDPKELQTMLDMVRAQKDMAPEQMKPVFPLVERTIEDRIKELEASKEGGK